MKQHKKHEHVPPAWYSLDNTACIFPSIVTARNTTVFRFSATLKEPVKSSVMQTALDNVVKRFPYFDVAKKAGLFWYYYEANPGPARLEADLDWPCQYGFLKKKLHHPFRVACFCRTVSVEMSHAITDGNGAMVFLKALLCEYFRLDGVRIADYMDVFRTDQVPDGLEFEDSMRIHYQKSVPHPPDEEAAYQIPDAYDEKGVFRLVQGSVPTAALLDKAKEYGASLTEFLTAIYLQSLQEVHKRDRRRKKKNWLRVVIPVNLRNLYQSKTMRNFVLLVSPGIDLRLGEYNFREIVDQVHHSMKMNINQKNLNMQISRNVSLQKNVFIRLSPVFIKNLIIPFFYNRMGETRYSSCISNIGTVKLPPEVAERIESFSFVPSPSVVYKSVCGIIGYEGVLKITFGRNTVNSEIERMFFSSLIRHGLPVRIREFIPGKEVF